MWVCDEKQWDAHEYIISPIKETLNPDRRVELLYGTKRLRSLGDPVSFCAYFRAKSQLRRLKYHDKDGNRLWGHSTHRFQEKSG